MKDFRLYDISDFVLDDDFIRWVREKAEDDELFWSNWLQQHPDKHLAVAEARRVVECMQLEQKHIADHDIEREVEKLLYTIQEQPARAVPVRKHIVVRAWACAAAVLLLLGAAGFWYFLHPSHHIASYSYAAMVAAKKLVEHTNTSARPVLITLPDNSRLTLAPQSKVSYANTLDTGATRDVYLLGEAFFEVTKNPHRPFRVFANEIVTKVLGTSFTVRSFEKDTAISVIVRTGKVSVYANENTAVSKNGEIIVTPNQQLVYEKAARKFQRVLLSNPVIIAPASTDKWMVYDEAPLEKVFSDLSKAYGINIVCDNEVTEKCTMTADLRNEPFYRKLDLICSAIGGRYELIDGQVVIEAAGCK